MTSYKMGILVCPENVSASKAVKKSKVSSNVPTSKVSSNVPTPPSIPSKSSKPVEMKITEVEEEKTETPMPEAPITEEHS